MKNLNIKVPGLINNSSPGEVVKRFKDFMIKPYWNYKHHRNSIRLYSQFIRKNDLCFDIGSNIGNRAELFLELGAKIICVEPQQACINHLNKIFRNNKSITIVPKALSDNEGFAMLDVCEEAPILSTMSDKWKNEGRFSQQYKWTTTQKVPTTTLDTLIEQYGMPVFCKIDVEGFELTVLKGLTKPIPLISFEFTREFFQDATHCIDHLLSLGSVTFNCSIGETMKLLFPSWITAEELDQKLGSLKDKNLWGDIYAKFS
jgi:FkbM family methyltransferase